MVVRLDQVKVSVCALTHIKDTICELINNLVETLRRHRNVTIVGPSTFAAFVTSLQMGFRTLAIQERSSEVWKLLGAIKNQFSKFSDVLDAVKKKLGAGYEYDGYRRHALAQLNARILCNRFR